MPDPAFARDATFRFSENAPAVQDIDNSMPQIKNAVLGSAIDDINEEIYNQINDTQLYSVTICRVRERLRHRFRPIVYSYVNGKWAKVRFQTDGTARVESNALISMGRDSQMVTGQKASQSEVIRLMNLLQDIEDLDSMDMMGLLMDADRHSMITSLASWIEKERPKTAGQVMMAFLIMTE